MKRLLTLVLALLTAATLLTIIFVGDGHTPADAVGTVTASKVDSFPDPNSNGRAAPGETITYTVKIANGSASDATGMNFSDTIDSNTTFVPGSLGTTPIARNDAYPTVGNVSTSVGAGSGVLANDSDPDGTSVGTVTAFDATSVQGGNVSVSADGSFTYNPPSGYEGTDTFTYTLNDGEGNTDTATVTMTVSGMIWFVDNNAAACTTLAAGCGRLSDPFSDLTSLASINNGSGNNPAAGDNIFVYQSATPYTGGITLLNGQKLIGQDATDSLATITGLSAPTGATFPTMNTGGDLTDIRNASGNDVTLNGVGGSNTIRGLTLGNSSGYALSGSVFGTLSLGGSSPGDVAVNTTGGGVFLQTGTANANFSSVTSSGGLYGVLLEAVAGTVAISGGAISGSTTAAFQVTGGTVTVTDSGLVSNTGGFTVYIVNKTTSGNVTFTGSVTGGGQGVHLDNNDGATVTFSGGLSLTTTTNDGFRAVNGGTVAVCDKNPCGTGSPVVNTVTTTTGIPVNISDTTIGANGVTFQSVSSNGAATGILLSNSGSGPFVVTGTGSSTSLGGDASGGNIASATGADSSTAAPGSGVFLNNAQNVTLRRMHIHDASNYAVRSLSVNNFTLEYSTIDGTNGTNEASPYQDGSIILLQATGTGAITNSIISGGYEDNVRIQNSSGTLSSFNVTGSTITNNGSIKGNMGFAALATTTANMTVSVSGTTFQGNRTIAVKGDAADSSTLNFTALNNTIIAGSPNQGNQGIEVSDAGAGQVTFDIEGNSIGTPDNFATKQGLMNTGINVFNGTASTANMTGVVENNKVQNDDVNFSSTQSNGFGIRVFNSNLASIQANVTGNKVRGVTTDYGILAEASGTTSAPAAGRGELDVAVTNNDVLVNSGALDDIRLQARNFSTICGRVTGNTTGSGGTGFVGIFVRQANSAVFNLEDGASNLGPNNPAAATTGFTGTITGVVGNSCTTIPVALQLAPSTDDSFVANVRAPVSSEPTDAAQAAVPATASSGRGWSGAPTVSPNAPATAENVWPRPGVSPDQLFVSNDPLGALAAAAQPFNAPTVNLSIGTLPASKSITITFQVTVNNNIAVGQVCNQGTVTYGASSTLQTDDPDVVGASDPTCTPIELPDLTATKSHSPSGTVPFGSPWTWNIHIANGGTGDAVFPTAQAILDDILPDTSISYGSPTATNFVNASGTVNCTISSFALGCFSNGTVTILAGGSFDVQFTATPTGDGPYTNPRPGNAICKVDNNNYPGVVIESDETNNTCSDTVTIVAPDMTISKSNSVGGDTTLGNNWTWTLHVANAGNADEVYIPGGAILTDHVPTTDVTYGSPTFANVVGVTYTNGTGPHVGTGGIECLAPPSIPRVDCQARLDTESDTVTIAAGGGFDLLFTVTPSATGGYTNPDPGSAICRVVAGSPAESNATNNDCNQDSVDVSAPDLTATKTNDLTGPATVGNPWNWSITVTNNDSSSAVFADGQVVLKDDLPAGLTYGTPNVSGALVGPVACTIVSDTLSCTASGGSVTIGNGESVIVQFSATASSPGTYPNPPLGGTCAADPDNHSVESDENNNDCSDSVVVSGADLSITKADDPDPVTAGNPLTYTLTVHNAGPQSATNVIVTDNLGIPLDSGSAKFCIGVACDPSTGVAWTGSTNVGTLLNGADAVVRIQVTVSESGINNADFGNTASVSSDLGDPDTANNSDFELTTIHTSADLEITKTDSPDPVTAGGNLTYTITVTNHGPSESQDLDISDATPTGTTFVSLTVPADWVRTDSVAVGGTGTITAHTTELHAGNSRQFTLVVNVNANVASGSTIENSVTVTSSSTSDPDSSNDTGRASTTVGTKADLEVTKTDLPDPVAAGANLTYTITVTNHGPSDAQSVSMSDTVPAGTTFVSVTTPAGWTRTDSVPAGGTGTITFTKATLAAGASPTFTLVVHVSAGTTSGTTITNNATASSTTTDPGVFSNTGTATTGVSTSADLEVTKTDLPDPVTAGANLTYTVTITNHGPSDAQSIGLSDTLPAGTTFVSTTTPAGWTRTDSVPVGGTGTLTFTKTTLTNGTSSVFTIVVHVNANVASGTTITNNAVGSTTTTDPGGFSNTGTATTNVQTRADLEVTKTDSPDPVTAGSNLTYTITLTNHGPSDAQTVQVSDTLPAGTTFVSLSAPGGWSCTTPAVGSGGTVTCSISTLSAGAAPVFTLVVNVGAGVADNTVLSNSATATSATTDPNPGNETGTATTTVKKGADLQVTKTESSDPVVTGSDLTYVITVKNNGPLDTTGVTVHETLTLPSLVTLTSATPSKGTYVIATGVWTVGSLTNGEWATLTLVIHVDERAQDRAVIHDTAAITASDVVDPNTGNNSATEDTTITAPPCSGNATPRPTRTPTGVTGTRAPTPSPSPFCLTPTPRNTNSPSPSPSPTQVGQTPSPSPTQVPATPTPTSTVTARPTRTPLPHAFSALSRLAEFW